MHIISSLSILYLSHLYFYLYHLFLFSFTQGSTAFRHVKFFKEGMQRGSRIDFLKRALHLDLDPKISVSQEAQVLSCLLDCPNSDSDPRMHPNTGLYHHLNLAAATKLFFMSRDRILFADLELRI